MATVVFAAPSRDGEGQSEDLVRQVYAVQASQQAQADAMIAAKDPRHYFAETYAVVTENIITQVQAGQFEHPDVVLKDVLKFHQYYADNLAKSQAGLPAEKHWEDAWERGRDLSLIPSYNTDVEVASLALSEEINAHIFYDLPRAMAEVMVETNRLNPTIKPIDLQEDFEKLMTAFEKSESQMRPRLPASVIVREFGARIPLVRRAYCFDVADCRKYAFGKAVSLADRMIANAPPVPGEISGASFDPSLLSVQAQANRKNTERNTLLTLIERAQQEAVKRLEAQLDGQWRVKVSNAAVTAANQRLSDATQTVLAPASTRPVILSADQLKRIIPAGWVPCQCPGTHPNAGLLIDGERWHTSALNCSMRF